MEAQKKAPTEVSALTNQDNSLNITLCSGFGQYHSAKNKRNPKPYVSVTLDQIEDMAAAPQSVAKDSAQWAIFSNLASRDVVEQRKNGEFYALWADIDEPQGRTLKETFSLAQGVMPFDMLGYTSRSATEEKQKGRFIIPLAHPVSGRDFEILQKILNDKLESVGITPDRKTETANQICYLPNKGEFYDYELDPFSGSLSVDDWGEEYHAELQAIEAAEEAHRQRLAQSEVRRIERMESGAKSPIDAMNSAYRAADLLEKYGGKVKGDRACSPLSESGNYQMQVKDDGKLLSHHGSDSEAGLGRETPKGCRLIDAWDLFVFFEHKGDETAALHDAGNTFTTAKGVTLEKQNQRDYMAQQSTNTEAVNAMFDNENPSQADGGLKQPEQKQKFDFKQFSLNGSSAEMKAQMLEDRHVLGQLAILGQATAFYAKPNSGKTLLTLWLLCEAIENEEISADDVYYINADDNYKGLVTKLEIAEKYGFNMVAPGFNEFSVNDFTLYMAAMANEDSCKGKVIILDTLKKFTNIMDKKVASDFGKVMRGFVSKGGTMILLAHTNKNRDIEGKVVFSGTSDIVDDVDCAYTIDVTESSELQKTVLFENIKSRGDVEHEAVYSYANNITAAAGGYTALLDSVKQVAEADAEELKRQRTILEKLEKNAPIIEAVLECLENGEVQKTELIEQAHKLSGVSKERVTKTLRAHTGKDYSKGHRWTERKGEKNSRLVRALRAFDGDDPLLNQYRRQKDGA